jgi:ADP-heptose:LPS heptosyltransferase
MNYFIKEIYRIFLEMGDGFILWLFPSRERRSSLHEVLLVRPDALGDFVLWLDAVKDYRDIYPPDKYRITLIANAHWATLAVRLSYWDEVISLDRRKFLKNPFYRWVMMAKIRKYGFHVVIHPVFSREYFLGDALVRASGARRRIGFSGDISNSKEAYRQRADKWYTTIIRGQAGIVMELQRNAEFVRALGLQGFKVGIPHINLVFNLPDGFPLKGDYFVVCPGTARGEKRWPLEKFAELINRVCQQTGWKAVLCGAENEMSIVEKLKNLLKDSAIDYAGKTSLDEFFAIISKARMVVGNDSSSIHIATALGVPSVAIVGGGHFGRFVPYDAGPLREAQILPLVVYQWMDCFNCNWKCIYHVPEGSPCPCVGEISENLVWKAVEKIITEA